MNRYPIFIPLALLSGLLLSLLTALHLASSCSAQTRTTTALVLEVKGVIGPALSDYVQKGLETALEQQAGIVILQMDTPGGLDSSMRDIVKKILASPVPVATYVAPGGSRAASAGTYILYASHIAAMAPATNLGAATPIRIGGWPGMPEKTEPADKDPKETKDPNKDTSSATLERKMVNDAEAYIRALADRHNRNSEWGAKAVREAVSLTAAEALQLKVIDLVADDLTDLLHQMDGRDVVMASGRLVLRTKGLEIEHLQPDWRSRLLMVLTDPNIAYILLLLGMYGLFFEMINPGSILPGVIGAISMVIALYTFQVLPINYAGLLLILLGIAFMVAEAFLPSFGALGLGGIVAFVIGSSILMDDAYLRVSISLIAATTLFSAGFMILVLARLITIHRKTVRTGKEEMIGSLGYAMEDFTTEGPVWIHGESWRGRSMQPVKKGQTVRITALDGLTLNLEITKEEEKDD